MLQKRAPEVRQVFRDEDVQKMLTQKCDLLVEKIRTEILPTIRDRKSEDALCDLVLYIRDVMEQRKPTSRQVAQKK